MVKVILGKQYRDVVTGYVGRAIARAEYEFDSSKALIACETKQAPADARWIEEARLDDAPIPPGGTGF